MIVQVFVQVDDFLFDHGLNLQYRSQIVDDRGWLTENKFYFHPFQSLPPLIH